MGKTIFFKIPKRKRPKNTFVIGAFDPNKNQTIPRGYTNQGYASGLSDTNVVGASMATDAAPAAMGESLDYTARVDDGHIEQLPENKLYAYGDLYFLISLPNSIWMESWCSKNISTNDLYIDQDECIDGVVKHNEHHVSLLYGITVDNPDELNDICFELGKSIPTLTCGKLFKFTDNDNYDALCIEIIPTQELIDFQSKLSVIPHENIFNKFTPHITIAYIKKNSLPELDGYSVFNNISEKPEALTFSNSYGETSTYYSDIK